MLTPTSVRNPALKEIRKAVAHGSLTDSGFCVAESVHLLGEAVRSGCEIYSVFAVESARPAVESQVHGTRGLRVVYLADELFREIAATEHSQGVLALVKPPRWNLDQLFSLRALVVVLDGIQDPGNAGAIVRAAEAFGATGVAFCKGSVNPYNPKAVRASAGSIFRMPLVASLQEDHLLSALAARDMHVFAMMPRAGLSIQAARMDRSCAVIVGNESHGISESLLAKATRVCIPTMTVESLNAAMAATIVLYEASKQRMGESQ